MKVNLKRREEDFYEESSLIDASENEEISPSEEAFMMGYLDV